MAYPVLPEERERIVGFAKLVGQLEAMIQDSGEPTNFDARAWVARWLVEPSPATALAGAMFGVPHRV